jgi:putative transposase
MCRVLGVSTSGYYAWRRRGPSPRALEDAHLTERIRHYHRRSDETYGAPRIHADLADEGHRVGRKRVARLMQAAGLQGVTRRKGFRTTQPDRDAPPAPDLVERDFTAAGPNELWVADITYVPTWSGFLFLAVVLDVWSRRVVGWAMATHLKTQLVLDALAMATFQRQADGVIHHCDRGCQYTALAFGRRCKEAGIQLSMGSTGDCFDNALAESFFATLECELIARRCWKSPAEAEPDLFHYLEGWYNSHRRHSALGQISPAEFERRYHQPSPEGARAARFRRTLGADARCPLES